MTCTLTHTDHAAAWRSWRDDCDNCGYYAIDTDQCDRGHPDDGVDACGACRYAAPGTAEARAWRRTFTGCPTAGCRGTLTFRPSDVSARCVRCGVCFGRRAVLDLTLTLTVRDEETR